MRLVFLYIILLVAITLAENNFEKQCPEVFDGLTNGHFDLSQQFSTSTLSANWNTVSNVLSYEVAIVSSNLFSREKAATIDSCRLYQGFLGNADIKNWVNVRKENSITFNNLKLISGESYFVVLRTTLSNGVQLFSNSNGVVILTEENKLQGSNSHEKQRSVSSTSQKEILTDTHNEVRYSSHRIDREQNPCVSYECDIDEENRCNRQQISVQDYLNQFYGPPKWIDNLDFELFGFVLPVFLDDDGQDDDDDDDGYSDEEKDGIIAGVIAGVLLLFLLCLCVLFVLALLLKPSGGEQPFNERITNKTTDITDADIGKTTEHKIGADTRVEFPDIDPHTSLSQA